MKKLLTLITILSILIPTLTAQTVTDIDGNVYPVITIGEQEWMGENLRVSRYQNGDELLFDQHHTVWQNTTEGIWAYYDDNPENGTLYGKLYNWNAVIDERGLCPAGWRVPTNDDWQQLVDFVDPDAWGNNNRLGTKLKSCRQVNHPHGGECATNEHPRWDSHGRRFGTDDFRFGALPAGSKTHGAAYVNKGQYAYFWSSSEIDLQQALIRVMLFSHRGMSTASYMKRSGFSARCIKVDEDAVYIPTINTSEVFDITETTAISGGIVLSDGGSAVTERGIVYSTSINPSLENNDGIVVSGSGLGEFVSEIDGLTPATTYYVKAYATNDVGTAYGSQRVFETLQDDEEPEEPTWTPCPDMPTVTDIDGNVYNTVLIGDQCWMKDNLKTRHYSDGTEIPLVTSTSEWNQIPDNTNTIRAMCYQENDENSIYGALYNWAAALNAAGTSNEAPSGIQGACPVGWHIPSLNEWMELQSFFEAEGYSENIGTVLKETYGWAESGNGTDNYGFSAKPGGRRDCNGSFLNTTLYGRFWSTTEIDNRRVRNLYLRYDAPSILYDVSNKSHGFSVRCVRYPDTPTTHPLNINVSPEGSGEASGAGDYEAGTEVNITATPNEGYVFINWTIGNDTISIEANYIYTMPDNEITILANFEEIPLPGWTTLNSGTIEHLFSVFFVNEMVGYACGANGTIVKTTNGGADWEILNSGTTNRLNDLYFTDENTGFVVGGIHDGGVGAVLKTIDGGDTWIYQKICNNALTGIHMINAQKGFVTGGFTCGTGLFRTDNGGDTWTSVTNPNSSLWNWSLYFVNEDIGYVVGSYDKVIKTTNGGNTWTGGATMSSSNHLIDVWFTSELVGYSIGYTSLKKTINGGASWTTLTNNVIPSHASLSIRFINSETGYYTAGKNLYKTSDAGATWSVDHIAENSLTKTFFFNENRGFAVGTGGMILKFTGNK